MPTSSSPNNPPMRWLTCTPVSFSGGEDFFSRDSGLLSRGFLEIGIDSYAIMPEPAFPEDLAGLVRVPYPMLEDPAWWKAQEADGVVLYAWGHPAYRRVAAAIREAGIFLVLNQDSCGVVSPLNGPSRWLEERRLTTGAGRVPGGWSRFFLSVAKGLTFGLVRTEPLRAQHLRCGDIIAAVSPVAADHYRRLCRIYGGKALADKVEVLPHPISPIFRAGEMEARERVVVAIGRWEDERQKRATLLAAVAENVCHSDPEVSWLIAGTAGAFLNDWHGRLPASARDRIRLAGRILPEQLASHLRGAMVLYCPSAYESFHIASGEALCSGCTVVGPDLASMGSFRWFCEEESGTLVRKDSIDGHVEAVAAELRAWKNGRRDPEQISARWMARLHASAVARRMVALRNRFD